MDLAQYGLSESDIEFLRKKSLSGDLIIVTGSATTVTDICSYTPASGKTFFLYKASAFSKNVANSGVTYNWLAELQNNAVVKDYFGGQGTSNFQNGATSSANVFPKTESVIHGDSLIGDALKKYRLYLSVVTSATVYGTIIGWIEDS